MDIGFRKITDFPRGTLCTLLKEGYSFEPRFERDCLNQWQELENFSMTFNTFSRSITVKNDKWAELLITEKILGE